MQTFWKIWFWFFCILYLAGIITWGKPSILDIIFGITGILGLVALYAYAYKKKIFVAIFWKIYLFYSILTDIYLATVDILNRQALTTTFWVAAGLTTLISVVSYIAEYNYAFKFLSKDEYITKPKPKRRAGRA